MFRYLLFIVLSIASVSVNTYSQPPEAKGQRAEIWQDFLYEIKANYEYGFDTDLDGGGEFNLKRYSISGDFKAKLHKKWDIEISQNYNQADYDFTGSSGLAGLNPWSKIHRAGIGTRLVYRINQKWGVAGGPMVRYAGESGADFGDSLTYGGTLGFLYTPNRNLFLGAGLFITSRIEDSVLIVPGVLLNWQINEKFRVSSLLTGIRTELGPRVQFAYDIGKGFSTGLNIGYEFQRFRLDDDGIVIDGVGHVRVLPVWCGLYYDISRVIRLAIYSGAGLFGEMELENSAGDRILREDFDPLVFVGGGIRINL